MAENRIMNICRKNGKFHLNRIFSKRFNFSQKRAISPKLICFLLCSHIFKYTKHDNFMSKSHYTEYIFKFQSLSFIVLFFKRQRTAYILVFHIAASSACLHHSTFPPLSSNILKIFASVIEIFLSR